SAMDERPVRLPGLSGSVQLVAGDLAPAGHDPTRRGVTRVRPVFPRPADDRDHRVRGPAGNAADAGDCGHGPRRGRHLPGDEAVLNPARHGPADASRRRALHATVWRTPTRPT